MSDFASAAQIGLPVPATPAASGTALSTAASAGRSLASDAASFRHLGLAMLFTVKVDGLGTLGQWTSCEGLKVEFKFDKVRSGGEYEREHLLPQGVVYSPITLKRGVELGKSSSVQDWLRLVVQKWQLWEGVEGTEYSGTMVTIDLLDVYQNQKMPVATWTLQNAYPVSWTGPTMNARTNEVALETLVLEHAGFLERP
jgi:phage tail-like protein